MVISLKDELIMNSYKTIDGRGAKVEIANGPCIIIDGVSHVIIHGIIIHDCKPSKPAMVKSSPNHVEEQEGSDGDANITISASSLITAFWLTALMIILMLQMPQLLSASLTITSPNVTKLQRGKRMETGRIGNGTLVVINS